MTPKGVHNVKDMLNWYKKHNPDTDINYKQFNAVIGAFYKKVVEAILDGKTYNLGNRLGKIRIQRLKRSFKNPTIDWYETNKLKKETGETKFVYYTDEYYYRWYWQKKRCQVKNKTVYSFKPTRGENGITKKLAKKLKEDEFSYLLYSG
jgi:hypothetical protein